MDNKVVDNETVYFDVLASLDKDSTRAGRAQRKLSPLRLAAFRKSRPAIVGGLIVIILTMLALFAEFFAPYPLLMTNARNAFIPPTRVHFIDKDGQFHLRPFVYPPVVTIDPKTFLPTWEEDTDKPTPIRFFVQGWEYKLLGLIPMNLHLFGVDEGGGHLPAWHGQAGRRPVGQGVRSRQNLLDDEHLWRHRQRADRLRRRRLLRLSRAVGWTTWCSVLWSSSPPFPSWRCGSRLAAIIPRTWDSFQVFIVMSLIFALLSWTALSREVRGKVLAMRETDFVLAAKEMGASDRRIVFLHLLPNTFSHIIVILTLTIPAIILAEAFLSFLGIGIQRPMVSWGLLMQDAQNLRTLGQTPWIMAPALFIIMAVLGFNLLGDGLRDAGRSILCDVGHRVIAQAAVADCAVALSH